MGLPLPHHLGAPQADPTAAEHEKEVPHSVQIFAGGVCVQKKKKNLSFGGIEIYNLCIGTQKICPVDQQLKDYH